MTNKNYLTLFAYTEIDLEGLRSISINPAQGSGVWALSVSTRLSYRDAVAQASLAIKHHVKHKYSSVLRDEIEARLNLGISMKNMTGVAIEEETDKPISITKLSHDVFRSMLPYRHPHVMTDDDLLNEIRARLKNPDTQIGLADITSLVRSMGIGIAPISREDIAAHLSLLGFENVTAHDCAVLAENAFLKHFYSNSFQEAIIDTAREMGLKQEDETPTLQAVSGINSGP